MAQKANPGESLNNCTRRLCTRAIVHRKHKKIPSEMLELPLEFLFSCRVWRYFKDFVNSGLLCCCSWVAELSNDCAGFMRKYLYMIVGFRVARMC